MNTTLATMLVQRWLDPARQVTAMRQLNGGMVNLVWAWRLDGEPGWLVAKINTLDHYDTFAREMAELNWYRRRSSFPVPTPYACFADEQLNISGLLMERVAGTNLADARLSPRGVASLQQQMAVHVAGLHTHTRATFGPAGDGQPGQPRWLDVFTPVIEREFHAVREQLGSRARETAHHVIEHLGHWLPEQATPTLVHGDLWTTNILVDDAHADRPRLLAFIDPAATYADTEYELAYLRLFQTADETFFETYTQQHPLRPGFERRCRVYWLNTMLLHIRLFGDRYVAACEDVTHQLRRLG
ncbi:MAG: fructosamine kinase family protein [Phycisphaeraceae bacterium]